MMPEVWPMHYSDKLVSLFVAMTQIYSLAFLDYSSSLLGNSFLSGSRSANNWDFVSDVQNMPLHSLFWCMV